MGQPLDEATSGAQENQPEVTKTTHVKKPYISPTIVEYGSIAKLTESGGLSAADGPVGFMMNP
jgi:hypothetical protein